MRRAAAPLLLLALAAGCRSEPEPAARPVTGGGVYVVVTDSSRVAFVLAAEPEAVAGVFRGVRGSLELEEDERGFLRGSGTLALDLAAVSLADSARARELAERVFQVGGGPESRRAELSVRELTGRRFRSDLAPGAVTPVTARGQLLLQRMALSRPFEGEISPTPQGYRITSTRPILFSARELGLGERLSEWLEAGGSSRPADAVVVSVDLRLARRDGGTPAAAD